MLSWILILAGGLWLAAIGINYLKSKGVSFAGAKVEAAANKIDDYADIVAGMSACFAITAIAKKRGDSELAAQVADVRVSLAKLADDSVKPAA
jgi:hypothetical protein